MAQDVRWLIAKKNMDSNAEGRRTRDHIAGAGSRHAIHGHLNPEEWKHIVFRVARKHVGDEIFVLRTGDLAFIPRNVYDGLEKASDT